MDWQWLSKLVTDGTFWTAVGALATLAAFGGILYAGKQFSFDAWLEAQRLFTDSAFTAARTALFKRLDGPAAQWTPEEHDAALLVCRRMDEFCHLARFLGKRNVLKYWGYPIAQAWALLEKTVLDERKRTHFVDKWDAFATLGCVAVKGRPRDMRAMLESVHDKSTTALPPAAPQSPLPPEGAA